MFRPFELCVGLRFTRAKRRNNFISFINLSSMLGIAIGVTALITVISVMNGFERELRERILGMASHATITDYQGALEDWGSLVGIAEAHKEVVGVAPFVESQAMLTNSGQVRGVVVRGVLPEREVRVAKIDDFIVEGSFDSLTPGSFNILLGKGLAQVLGASIGSRITLLAPQARFTAAGMIPRLRRFTVSGIFEVSHVEYDASLAVMHIEDAQRVFQLGEGVSGLRLMLDDMFQAPIVSRDLALSFGGVYWLRDWTQYHANFFRALKIERTVMFVILTLIVAVAAFNIVSALTMVVTDKEADIAILRTLGASRGSIMWIFITQGFLIGTVGTLLGVAGGISLAMNVETIVPAIEELFSVKFLSPQIYIISEVPSQMRWRDVALTSSAAFTMTVLATIYPAWRASKVQPVESLRHE
ncbi:lipoprotein-releasing ABC transporter permease subunit [Thioalkalivibrio sp. HK1]|uniref:lipoprotein-releasing ABC transporter permease subunit n=1 Tax=Thioalkalivibrio sp. HK1 TaxID=1469245 RepID=UPI0004712325|nr:lipoprotein-releasing ABC transporter permease subunit [Thioalkalivibrio sp. HK1]